MEPRYTYWLTCVVWGHCSVYVIPVILNYMREWVWRGQVPAGRSNLPFLCYHLMWMTRCYMCVPHENEDNCILCDVAVLRKKLYACDCWMESQFHITCVRVPAWTLTTFESNKLNYNTVLWLSVNKLGSALSQVTKALRESRGIALLYFRPLH